MIPTILALLTLQTGASVTGTVMEAGRLEPIRYALVELVDSDRRTLTDEDGLFNLGRLPDGTHRLRASAPGYRPTEVEVQVGAAGMEHVRLLMEPAPLAIGGALVIASRIQGLTQVESPTARVVDTLLMSLVPPVVERDLVRAVQHQPSVTPSSDFSTGLFVRGGTPDQTRVLLDGTPVHNVFHLGSFVSAFTTSATAAAVLQPGALPASAPSSLSGLLEVHTRDGGRDSVRIRGGVGLLSSELTVDGPLPATTGSFLLSGRRTYIDAAVAAGHRLGLIDRELPYGFSDVMAKLTHDLGPRASVTVSGYLNREGYDVPPDRPGDPAGEEVEVGTAAWGSDALSARVRGLLGERLQFEAGAGVSRFGAEVVEEPRAPGDPGLESSMRTGVADVEVRSPIGSHLVMAGVRWERTDVDHLFDTDAFDEVPDLDADGAYGSTAFFVRDRWSTADALTLDGGLRLERPRGRSWETLPRGRIEWSAGAGLSMALGSGRYVQDWWSPRNEEGVGAALVGYDLPIPVSGRPLPRGWDVVLEGRARWGEWTLRGDAFWKRLDGVAISPVSPSPLEADFTLDPDSLETGVAKTRGVELSATGQALGSAVFLSYRWQRERRLVGNRAWTPRSDRRHRLIIAARRPWAERDVAASLTWMSGPPTRRSSDGSPGGGASHPTGHGRAVGARASYSGVPTRDASRPTSGSTSASGATGP